MSDPKPLKRHRDAAFRALGVVNGSIHEAVARECARLDFERTLAAAILMDQHEELDADAAFDLLDVSEEDFDAWHARALESDKDFGDEDTIRELVELGWKDE